MIFVSLLMVLESVPNFFEVLGTKVPRTSKIWKFNMEINED